MTVVPFFGVTAPAFASYSVATSTYTFAPTSFSEQGTYPITAQICDTQPLCNIVNFQVVYANHAPAFSTTTPSTVTVNYQVSSNYTLPNFSDQDGDSITLTAT